MIADARWHVARMVDASMVILYWRMGQRIRRDILKEKRAEYGREIVSTLSNRLQEEFGRGFSRPNLLRMVRFAEVFPDEEIVSTLSNRLGWSHFVEILPLKDDLQPAILCGILPDGKMACTVASAENHRHVV